MNNKDDNTTGYLYILTNSSIPGQVKIGKTIRHPEDRKKELSSETGVPTPFKLKYYIPFKDCHKAERKIHLFLEKEGKRVSKNKEFFRIELQDAIKLMDKISDFEKNEELKEDITVNKKAASEFLKEGFNYLNGTSSVIKDFSKALEHFEQAGILGSKTGEYMSGVTSEKISYTFKRNKDKQEWSQRALNHYNKAISMGDIKSYAKASWLLRKTGQHNQANELWNNFLQGSLKKEHLDEENTLWILRWLDNQKNNKFELPFKDLWISHINLLKKTCNQETTPNGNALKILKNSQKNIRTDILLIIFMNLILLFLIFKPFLFSQLIWIIAFIISLVFSVYMLKPRNQKKPYTKQKNKYKKNRKNK